jgi:hypothetical protein
MSARCWEAEKKLDPEPGLHVSTLTACTLRVVDPDPVGYETNFWPDLEKIISDPDPGLMTS